MYDKLSSALHTIKMQGGKIRILELQKDWLVQRCFATVEQRDLAVLHVKDVIASELTWFTTSFFGDLNCKLVTWLGTDPEKENMCDICWQRFRFDTLVVQHGVCMDIWHPECLQEWQSKQASDAETCPKCRANLQLPQVNEEQD